MDIARRDLKDMGTAWDEAKKQNGVNVWFKAFIWMWDKLMCYGKVKLSTTRAKNQILMGALQRVKLVKTVRPAWHLPWKGCHFKTCDRMPE